MNVIRLDYLQVDVFNDISFRSLSAPEQNGIWLIGVDKRLLLLKDNANPRSRTYLFISDHEVRRLKDEMNNKEIFFGQTEKIDMDPT